MLWGTASHLLGVRTSPQPGTTIKNVRENSRDDSGKQVLKFSIPRYAIPYGSGTRGFYRALLRADRNLAPSGAVKHYFLLAG